MFQSKRLHCERMNNIYLCYAACVAKTNVLRLGPTVMTMLAVVTGRREWQRNLDEMRGVCSRSHVHAAILENVAFSFALWPFVHRKSAL